MASTPSLTLWYSPQASSIAPHILLLESGLQFELALAEVNMAQDGGFTGDFKAVNPKKRIPVLKFKDEIITEGSAIATMISSLAPDHKFFGETVLDAVRVYEWFNYLSGDVHGQAFGLAMRPSRAVEDPALQAAVREKALKNLKQEFTFIEGKLRSSGTSFAVGNSFTAADAYLFVLYRWAKGTIKTLEAESPYLSAWAGRMLERKAVRSALEVHTGV
ncbi:glutathione S-transferase [Periconia macrospinosa]|uniref:Glutathione S-transferase n=1 Tax=Periconia macrospinosa TaxID=97972 RepID=A0A2V1E2C9_9PLEO|nr:glutathione S-transferase [Periconia macrospinosa]